MSLRVDTTLCFALGRFFVVVGSLWVSQVLYPVDKAPQGLALRFLQVSAHPPCGVRAACSGVALRRRQCSLGGSSAPCALCPSRPAWAWPSRCCPCSPWVFGSLMAPQCCALRSAVSLVLRLAVLRSVGEVSGTGNALCALPFRESGIRHWECSLCPALYREWYPTLGMLSADISIAFES